MFRTVGRGVLAASLASCGPAPSAHEPEVVTLPPMPPVVASSVSPPAPPAPAAERGCSQESERPAVAPGSSTAPFDRSAAMQALAGVRVSCCQRSGEPRASGHVSLTFGNSGLVERAELDQGSLAGSAAGDCVVGLFKAVRVPAFGGPVVKVGKSFTMR